MGAVVTATCTARLSPGVHRTGYACAASVAPDQAGPSRDDILDAPHSPSVAAPSRTNIAAASRSLMSIMEATVASVL